MKTRFFCSLWLLFVVVFPGFSQTEKGSWLVGGNLSASLHPSQVSSYFYFSLAPRGGIFVADNLAIGAVIPARGYYSTFFTNYHLGLTSFVRYYVGQTATRFFLDGQLGYEYFFSQQKGAPERNSFSNGSLFVNGGLGIAHFISPHIGLEAVVAYRPRGRNSFEGNSNLGVNLGFQVYLPVRQE
jgi:hypothetical protein